jgi:hypothetical protein
MDRKRAEAPERFREEFAFDLTPDITDGGCSTFHRRSDVARTAEGKRGRKQNTAPDDVEWGPTVRGHDFRVH